ncbi:MAG: glycoside hydrolase family 130 protein [Elusimicrobia bacterium]|nr:glycoside hydrolase family 130 protein [Elusimicrobiota bacterium]
MTTIASFAQNSNISLTPDKTRTILRPFVPRNELQIVNIISRVMSLSENSVLNQLNKILKDFAGRHENIESIFLEHYKMIQSHLFTDLQPSKERKLLIGSYFSSEYTFESAALFNPSIIPHPDQANLPEGALRFIMSLRATGEGHISSLTFRIGTIDRNNSIIIDNPGKFAIPALHVQNPFYDKKTFHMKLLEMDLENDFSVCVLDSLKDTFAFLELTDSLKKVAFDGSRKKTQADALAYEKILLLALSNYETELPASKKLSDLVIFPASPAEQNGIEDARFVLFTDDDGTKTYYATYTAYDGRIILPQLVETRDFSHIKMITLNGKAVENKGMALFPRKINGKYAMLSRQDNENLFLMYSDNIHFWQETQLVMKPAYAWEFIQVGNGGSPVETDAGWLVLTHGVGPVRRYCISAVLLDKNDPTIVLGRLKEPLIMPDKTEMSGYVPNVVYTCGVLIHNQNLILPYAKSDNTTTIAVINLKDLLTELKK